LQNEVEKQPTGCGLFHPSELVWKPHIPRFTIAIVQYLLSWTEREGRLLKLLSGVMMLELGLLLLLAPERLSQVGVAFALMGLALGITWIAARATRNRE
jgi:hypothetical protein